MSEELLKKARLHLEDAAASFDPLVGELADALEKSLKANDILRDKVLEAKKGCHSVCLKVRRLEAENRKLKDTR